MVEGGSLVAQGPVFGLLPSSAPLSRRPCTTAEGLWSRGPALPKLCVSTPCFPWAKLQHWEYAVALVYVSAWDPCGGNHLQSLLGCSRQRTCPSAPAKAAMRAGNATVPAPLVGASHLKGSFSQPSHITSLRHGSEWRSWCRSGSRVQQAQGPATASGDLHLAPSLGSPAVPADGCPQGSCEPVSFPALSALAVSPFGAFVFLPVRVR